MSKEFTQISWDAATGFDCRQLVRLWVHEDLERQHDWTTLALVPPDEQGRAAIVNREAGILCGLRAAEVALDEMNITCAWQIAVQDGQHAAAGTEIATIQGQARELLTAERLLLNLIGRLSGIATLTHQYVSLISDTPAAIYDTRKTLPGWRRLEKYAVRCGGGKNHRSGLFDAILIKDNHLDFATVANPDTTPAHALQTVRHFLQQSENNPSRELVVEIEVDSLEQLRTVLPECPDIVLLDNMDPGQLREAVRLRDRAAPLVQLEASGGIHLDTVISVAQAGVDRISVGALTHSAHTLDVGLDWKFSSNAT